MKAPPAVVKRILSADVAFATYLEIELCSTAVGI